MHKKLQRKTLCNESVLFAQLFCIAHSSITAAWLCKLGNPVCKVENRMWGSGHYRTNQVPWRMKTSQLLKGILHVLLKLLENIIAYTVCTGIQRSRLTSTFLMHWLQSIYWFHWVLNSKEIGQKSFQSVSSWSVRSPVERPHTSVHCGLCILSLNRCLIIADTQVIRMLIDIILLDCKN